MNSSDDPDDSDPVGDDDFLAEQLADLDRPLHEVLGIEPNFAPDDLAPPVTAERLLAFVRDELSPDEREEVLTLIASFRPWLRGWAVALRRRRQDGDVQP